MEYADYLLGSGKGESNFKKKQEEEWKVVQNVHALILALLDNNKNNQP